MKRELKEALRTASDGDRKIMENALDNLKINLDDENLSPENVVTEAISDKMFDLNNAPKTTPDGIEIEYVNIDDFDSWLNEGLDDLDEAKKDEDQPEDKDKDKEEEKDSDKDKKEDKKDKKDDKSEKKKDDKSDDESEEFEPKNEFTVKEITDAFKGLDKDAVVKVLPVEIDNKEMNINLYFDKTDEDNLVIGGNIVPIEDDENIDADDSNDEDTSADAEVAAETATDDGEDGVIEGLKEAIRQKNLLDSEVKSLRSEKTVSDAKVLQLTEELNKYKSAFARTSELAAQAKEATKLSESLKAELSQKNAKIARLEAKNTSNNNLTESINAQSTKVKTLTEKLNNMQAEFDKEKATLNEQLGQYKKAFAERTNIAKQYKEKFNSVITRYVESKAHMLGVKPTEITSRLPKNYTIDDVDTACDNILTESVNTNKLPFGLARNSQTKTQVKINESKISETRNTSNSDCGYEIDDSFLELAGLK